MYASKKFAKVKKNMKNFDEQAIIERIRVLRERYAGSRGKSKFARDLGISASTYNYYENNRIPPIEILLKISEVTGANLRWLLTGEKSEEKFASASNGRAVFRSDASLLQKIDAVLAQNPELTEAVLAFIELLSEKRDVEKELSCGTWADDRPVNQTGWGGSGQAKRVSSGQGREGWIPVLGRTAAGMVHFWDEGILPAPKQAVTELDELVRKYIGKTIISTVDGTMSIDLQARALVDSVKSSEANLIQVSGAEAGEIVEFVQCKEIYELFADSFALRIDGESMSPRINDGDIVILSPSVPAAQGQIGVARVARQIGVTCKLIRTTGENVHLIPINEKYETKAVPKKDLQWALAVLCHIRI